MVHPQVYLALEYSGLLPLPCACAGCSEGGAADGGGAESSGVSLCLVRAPLMPLLTVEAGASILFRPFKSPLKGHLPGESRPDAS